MWGAWRPRSYRRGSAYYGRFGGWRHFSGSIGRWLDPWRGLVLGARYVGRALPYGFVWGGSGYWQSPYFPGLYLTPWQLQYALASLDAYGYGYDDEAAMEAALVGALSVSRSAFARYVPSYNF